MYSQMAKFNESKDNLIMLADFDETKFDPVQSAINTFLADPIDSSLNQISVGVF